MRPLYFIAKYLTKIPLWIYYPEFRVVNAPKKRNNSTIYMSNHSNSFMDPLVVGSPLKAIVFFMTRADIYKGFMKTVFWAAHMLPIYRQQDGGNSKEKNVEVFKNTSALLNRRRNILIFAEGFTDDVFVRRLKPVKKGSIKMGFEALEAADWENEIFVQAMGINYTDRNEIGGGCLISYGNLIRLNDYREEYEEDESKLIKSLTEIVELNMREQITDVRNEELTDFHENLMRLTRKGMNQQNFDKKYMLEERWIYSKNLAAWINEQSFSENSELIALRNRVELYFQTLEEKKIEESTFYLVKTEKRKRINDVLYLAILFPLFCWSMIHTFIPVKLIKDFVEKSFKRSVFWGSVKMMLGLVAVGIYNMLLFLILYFLTGFSFGLVLLAGVVIIPLLFVVSRNWSKRLSLYREANRLEGMELEELWENRTQLEEDIKRVIPVA